MKVARISTVPIALIGYGHHFEYLVKNGVELTIICSRDELFHKLEELNITKAIGLEIKREISPLGDLISLWKLYRLFREEKYDIVHSNTPKAGLLTAIAGYMARIPTRIHTFTGQRWETLRGLKRYILIKSDLLIAKLNTQCYSDSPSQSLYLNNIFGLRNKPVSTIHKGSFAGVDLERFNPERWLARRPDILRELGVASGEKVIMYIGRVVKDKGIRELLASFQMVANKHPNTRLIIIGPYERESDPLPEEFEKRLLSQKGVTYLGFRNNPEKFLCIADIFCLPSYREGFGSAVLEAGAMKLPSIGTDITGLKDAIVNGVTGLLVPPKDVDALTASLLTLLEDDKLRHQMGEAAFSRIQADFSCEKVSEALYSEYTRLTGYA